MPFRNSVVAAVISTALAGSRIVIDGTGALANYIRFYTGKATESAPATITGQAFGPADPSYPNALYLGLEGARHTDDPLRNPATLRLITTPGPNMAMQADADYITLQATTQASMRSAGVAEIDADIITLGKYSIPLSDPPALRLGAFSTMNVLGAWTPWSPSLINSGGINPTFGNSVVSARYLQIGKTVTVMFFMTTGTTWAAGSAGGNISLVLPVASRASSFVSGVGSMIYVNSGGTFIGVTFASNTQAPLLVSTVPAVYIGEPQLPSGAGKALYIYMTYEAA